MTGKYTVFHGTKNRFDEFTPSVSGAEGPGIYFVDRKSFAAGYGDLILECEVEMRNPFFFYPSDESFESEVNPDLLEKVLDPEERAIVLARMEREGVDGYGTEVQSKLKRAGHDGIIMVCPWGEPALPGLQSEAVVIAFDAQQVQIKKVHKAGPRP